MSAPPRTSSDGGHAKPSTPKADKDKSHSKIAAEESKVRTPMYATGSLRAQQMLGAIAELNSKVKRFTKFKNLLDLPNVDLEQLKKLSWMGIPDEIRPTGYLPANSDRREATLQRKRKEYAEYIDQSFGEGKASLDQALHHQIHIDIQRTNASIPLYQNTRIQEVGARNVANVYLTAGMLTADDVESTDVQKIPDTVLEEVEADSFWCLTKLLDGIQDNYTFNQPGIQRQISRLKELINRIDAPLYNHLQGQGVEFIQFAFRWMNCLLMRELSLKNTIRMWDSYQAEGTDGFSDFHLYVCAAFLVKWSEQLRKMEFQDVMIFVQSPPTSTWEDKDIELLLSEAFMWKSLFHNSPSHLTGNGS
ncbi:GTPase-activating protein [Irineochytrium annulatum]|nr:GTPase-activating protein [Irineochytrium annulatum]